MKRLQASRTSISRALIVAGLFLGVSLALTFLSPGHLSPEAASRSLGVLMGALVVVYSNAVPKALSPLVRIRCDPAAEQAIRRFTGWTLTMGGMAYMAVWLMAPYDIAAMLAASLLATALLVAIVRASWGRTRAARN